MRRIQRAPGWARSVVAALAAGILGGCADALPSGPKPIAPPGEYSMPWAQNSGREVQFRSRIGGAEQPRCMNVEGGSRDAGARVTSGECLNDPRQFFRWYAATGEIRVYDGTPDVKCVDDAGGHLSHGDAVIIWHCHGGAPQRWEPAEGGLRIRLRGTTLCIDVPYGDVAPGTGLIVAECWDGPMQHWAALAANPSAPQGLHAVHGWGRHTEFRSAVADDRCMGVEGGSRSDAARIVISNCVDAPHQTFVWDAGTHEIRVYDRTADMKCVDDGGGHLSHGDPVIIWPCHGGAPQRWEPLPDGTGIRLQGTNLCIDVPWGDPTPGTGLIVANCWGGVMQRWTPATVLYAAMDGWQPTPNLGADHSGSGSARFSLLSGGDRVCASVAISSTRHGEINEAHIHPSPRGEGAPLDVAHWVQGAPLIDGLRSSSTGRECTHIGSATVQRILDDPASFYFNVHTPNNPVPAGGILRGQLSTHP